MGGPPRVGLAWDEKTVFSRFIEDCGATVESVTPYMLGSPFWKGTFSVLLVPTGFASSKYSRLLPALKASATRIRRFLEGGGTVIVFGAADERPDAYCWLPVTLEYSHATGVYPVNVDWDSPCADIVEGYDVTCLPCDGYFTRWEGTPVATCREGPVLVAVPYGRGEIIATTIHEYPSRRFIERSCQNAREGFL